MNFLDGRGFDLFRVLALTRLVFSSRFPIENSHTGSYIGYHIISSLETHIKSHIITGIPIEPYQRLFKTVKHDLE